MDKGESVNTLLAAETTPGAPTSPILPSVGGFLFQDPGKFHDWFGGDLPDADAAFMAASQVPFGVDALAGPVTEPPGAASQAGT
jgi:hypothetical protein